MEQRCIQSTWPLSCTISRSVFYQKVLAVLSVIVGDVPITAVHVGQLHSEHVVAIGLVSAAHALVVKRGPGVELCTDPSAKLYNHREGPY